MIPTLVAIIRGQLCSHRQMPVQEPLEVFSSFMGSISTTLIMYFDVVLFKPVLTFPDLVAKDVSDGLKKCGFERRPVLP